MLGSILDRDVIYSENCQRFPQSLQANVGIVSRLDHAQFIPNPCHSSIIHHPPIRRRTV
jgi:hypothetical protein